MSVLRERVVVVTGGASGIGRAAALLCGDAGARVAVLDVDGSAATAVARESVSHGATAALGIRCDVGSERQVEHAFGLVREELGVPRGVFANAGVASGGLIHDLDLEEWNRVLSINLTGVFLTCKHALRAMVTAGQGGSIVCTSSPAAFVSQAAGSAALYSATKGGVSALVRCLAIDYAPCGIRVNAVVPGATETPLMWQAVAPADIGRLREQVSTEVPLGRLATPPEPARAAVWLLSDEASYVTGSHLVCDGGILAKGSISV